MLHFAVGSGWRHAILVLLALWLATLWQFSETAIAMATIWEMRETFAHAWVVPPISLWLAWRLRAQVFAVDPAPAPWLLLPMAIICGVWLSGAAVAVAAAQQFALVALLVLAVPLIMGWRVANLLAFPLGFVFFCVPIGEFLSPTLMQWTADFTIAALRASGIPVYREGLMFVIPSGRWSVIEACSGIRYLIASLMVGCLFAYLNYQTLWRRWLFVGISILVPLVANWLRAYMIVMLGHLSGNTIAVGVDHLLYGWVFFGIVILTLYWIGAKWAEIAPDGPSAEAATGAWPTVQGAIVAFVACIMMAVPIGLWRHIDASTSSAPVHFSLPDAIAGGWQRADDPAPKWRPGFLNPSFSIRQAYRDSAGITVGVFVGYYRHQDAERKLVSSVNRLIHRDDTVWNLLSVSNRSVSLGEKSLDVTEGVVLPAEGVPGMRQQVRAWQTYRIDGGYVANNILAKLRGAWGRLSGRGDDSAVLIVFTEGGDGAAAQDAMVRFLSQALPALTVILDSPRLAISEK